MNNITIGAHGCTIKCWFCVSLMHDISKLKVNMVLKRLTLMFTKYHQLEI